MFKRDWLRYASALTFQLLALGLALNIIYAALMGGLELHNEWREQHEYERNQTREATKTIARDCGIAQFFAFRLADCLAEQVNRYIEEEHRDQDLQAQKDMAYWAQMLFWLTGFGSLISIVGIVLLFASLRQTSKAISDTREIGEKQVRAYIGVVPKMDDIAPRDFRKGGSPEVSIAVRNSGNSPALNFRYAAGFGIQPKGFPTHNGMVVEPVSDGPIPRTTVAVDDEVIITTRTEITLTDEVISDVVRVGADKRFFIFGVILYDDVFGKPHTTRFCFSMKIGATKEEVERTGIAFAWQQTANHNDAD